MRRHILKAPKELVQGIEPSVLQHPEAARVLPTRMVLPPEANVADALRPFKGACRSIGPRVGNSEPTKASTILSKVSM